MEVLPPVCPVSECGLERPFPVTSRERVPSTAPSEAWLPSPSLEDLGSCVLNQQPTRLGSKAVRGGGTRPGFWVQRPPGGGAADPSLIQTTLHQFAGRIT